MENTEAVEQKRLQFDSGEAVCLMAGIGRAQMYALIARGEFPKPVKLGRAARWERGEVQAWMRAKMEQRK